MRRARMTVPQVLILPALALVLLGTSGCAGPFGASACTEIGCTSAVVFNVSEDLVAGETYEVEACAADVCRSARLSVPRGDDVVSVTADGLELFPERDQVRLDLPNDDDGRTRTVMLTITDESGDRIVDATAEADFEQQRPNGPDCPPVCWVGQVRT
jgi:hypothetical protein